MKVINSINTLSALFLFVISCFVLSGSSIFAQDMENMPMHDKKNMKHDKAINKADSAIVHKGVIDLKAIDKNKDGIVFQDQMDWNVISDKPGKCPLCKMTLKEVTLENANENLNNAGLKVKDKIIRFKKR
ncbi:MAG: hypothetical protein KF816_08540 [Melioribacteraceae bacterium]|nr:hypothetical protein [Melioribacteraceae bacterium]